jgi:hypothetical protein
MKSYWWGQFMNPANCEHYEPTQWREALGVRGLYALIGGMEIVYIGKAACIGTRIKAHRRDDCMPFTAFSYQPFDEEDFPTRELAKLEADVIQELDPILNLRCTGFMINRLARIGKLHLRSIGKLPPNPYKSKPK